MTAKTTYLIDKQIVEFASLENRSLYVLISQMILAAMMEFNVTAEQLTNPTKHREIEAAEARQVLMLLIYNETPKSRVSRVVVSQLFGYTSAMVQQNAKRKYEKYYKFRKKYDAMKARYKKDSIQQYDSKIPF